MNKIATIVRQQIAGIVLAILIVAFMVAGILLAAPAGADGYLSPREQQFADSVADSVCTYISDVGVTGVTLTEAVRIIYVNTPVDMSVDDAVDIINYSVYAYCPQYWDDLVAFGEGVRS